MSAANEPQEAVARDSNLQQAISLNEEFLLTVEKQMSFLYERLQPVISQEEKAEAEPEKDFISHGSSDVVRTFNSHGRRLSNLSDRLARLMRELEI